MVKINKKKKKSSKNIIRKKTYKRKKRINTHKKKKINTHKKNKKINTYKRNILKGGSQLGRTTSAELKSRLRELELTPKHTHGGLPGSIRFTESYDEICSKHVDSTFSKIFFSNPNDYDIELIGEDVEKYDNIVFTNKKNSDKIVFSEPKYISEGQFGKIDLYSSDEYGYIVLKTEINDPSVFNDAIERELAKTLLNSGCNTIQEYSIEESACCHYDANTGEEYEIFYYLMEPGVMDLNTLVTSKQPGSTEPLIDPDTFKRIIESIIIDLKCLLQKGYYYTDLKLENILVVCDNDKEYRVKLGDIGSMVTLKDKGIWAQSENDKFLYTFWPPFVTFHYDDDSELDSKINKDRIYIILWNIGIMYLYYYFIHIEPPDQELNEAYIQILLITNQDYCDNTLNPILSDTFKIPFKYLTHDKKVMDKIIKDDGWSTGGLTSSSSS